MRIREIAPTRVRYGYRKIRVLLNREGWKVGKYLVERLYREEGLTLHQRRKRRRRVAEHRCERFHPTGPNQVWSMDFVADQLADGRRFRSLTVVDIYSECLAIKSRFLARSCYRHTVSVASGHTCRGHRSSFSIR